MKINPPDINFGNIELNTGQKELFNLLNHELLDLCRELPGPLQMDATMFLMNYSGCRMGEPFEFFRKYYVPAWSVLYWMREKSTSITDEIFLPGISAHGMAMFLHLLDDHLSDGQIKTNHTNLQLRTLAWVKFENEVAAAANTVPGGIETTMVLIDLYFSGINNSETPEDISEFSALFRKQMATWLIIPLFFARLISNDETYHQEIRAMYESFGLAWRFLDDLQDFFIDAYKGEKTSIHAILDDTGRRLRDAVNGISFDEIPVPHEWSELLDYFNENFLFARILDMICRELRNSAKLAKKNNLFELAHEYENLMHPLEQRRYGKKI